MADDAELPKPEIINIPDPSRLDSMIPNPEIDLQVLKSTPELRNQLPGYKTVIPKVPSRDTSGDFNQNDFDYRPPNRKPSKN